MKKIIILILLTIVFLSCSTNKNDKNKIKTDLQNDGLKGKVKSVSQHVSNVTEKFGEIIKMSGYETCYNIQQYDLAPDKNFQILYNESGNVLEADQLVSESLKKEYLSLGYDTIGFRNIMKYDDKGNKIEWTTYERKNSIYSKVIYKYGLNNKLIEQIDYGKDGNVQYKRSFEYDKSQNKIAENNFNKDGELSYKSSYKYDEKNNLLEDIEIKF